MHDSTAQLAPEDRGGHRTSGTPNVSFAVALLVVAIGSVLVVISYATAKSSDTNAHFHIYWAGTLAGIVAIMLGGAFGAVEPNATRRWTLLVLLGVFTFLPKFLLSPTSAVYFDEFGHWQHAKDLVTGHGFSAPVSFQPIVRDYPVLESLTAVVHWVTQLSVWHAGQIVVLTAHVAMLFIIYHLARAVQLRESAAMLASVIYSIGANFEFFSSQFAYESVGLPLAFATVLACFKSKSASTFRARMTWAAVAALLGVLTTMSHHVSAIVMLVLTSVVLVVVPATRLEGVERRRPRELAAFVPLVVFLYAFVIGWFVETPTGAYLGPGFARTRSALASFTDIFRSNSSSGDSGARTQVRHTPFSGVTLPTYERALAYIAPVVAGLLFLYGAYRVLRPSWRRRESRLLMPFILLGVVFFVSLPAVLLTSASEAAHRSWSFTWVGVAIICALALTSYQRLPHSSNASSRHRYALIAAVWVCVVMVGEVSAGSSPYTRFPGPQTFGMDTRFFNSDLTKVTTWAAANVPASAHVVTDRYTGQELTGRTRLLVPSPSQAGVYGLYRAGDQPWASLQSTLSSGQFSYWILDTRIETEQPYQSFFQGYRGYANSIDPVRLADIRDNQFIHLVTKVGRYSVYRISP